MTDPLSFVLVGIVGAIIGSFLNVCIFRLPIERSVIWPPSACPRCGRRLAWFENVPILSYLALGGRCRSCRAPIGIRYPLVEALTALMFAWIWWYFGPGPLAVSRLLFGSALLALFAIDFEHYLLPNEITLSGIVVGFGFSFITEPGWRSSLIGILVGGGALWGIAVAYERLRHEEGLGMGDVKMLAMIGAFLGWQLTLVSLMLASFAGSLIGILLILTRRGDMKYALPFGTFLAIGAAAAAVVGPGIVDWYVGQW